MPSAINPALHPTGADNKAADLRANLQAAKDEIEALQSGKADTAHSQTASTISDFAAEARAQIEDALVAGANFTITPSGSGATRELTLAATGGSGIQVDTYIGAGTYVLNIDPSAKELVWELIAPGGGSGSGRKGAAGTVRCGGGTGSPGARVTLTLPANLFAATATITIGAIGVGGAAVTANSTNGNNGTAGGNITVVSNSITWVSANGGAGGNGGTNAAGAGGAARTSYNEWTTLVQVGGAAASTTGGAGTSAANGRYVPCAGGSGGGITSGNAASAGGAGGGVASPVSGTGFIVTNGAFGSIGNNGGNGAASSGFFPGGGGGGGGSSITGNAGNGGNAAGLGGTGGGGGAALDGVGNSGRGGDGGPGGVRVTQRF